VSMAGRYVALIRGINVGRARRVAMADLRALVESLGYRDVRTRLNSGNVIFTADRTRAGDAARRVERAMAGELGVSARVTVLTAADVAAIVEGNPLIGVATNPSRLLVTVLFDAADREKLATVVRQDWTPEAIALGTRAAYLWCPGGVLASRLAEAVSGVLGDAVTTRTWATMLKLHALFGSRA
jgi:uncharacterized protein (DUF1697 family)